MSIYKPKYFDYHNVINGKIGDHCISVIYAYVCSTCYVGCQTSKKCTGHSLSIFAKNINTCLQHNYSNGSQNFTLDELIKMNYISFIKLIVNDPENHLQKCELAQYIGIKNIIQDND